MEDQPTARAATQLPSWFTPGLVIGGVVGFIVMAIVVEEWATTPRKGEIE